MIKRGHNNNLVGTHSQGAADKSTLVEANSLLDITQHSIAYATELQFRKIFVSEHVNEQRSKRSIVSNRSKS